MRKAFFFFCAVSLLILASGTGTSLCAQGTRFVYVVNYGAPAPGSVSGYSINGQTGALTAVAGSPFPAGSNPDSIAIVPSGRFAYVSNQGDSTISAYAIDAVTGALTPTPGSPFSQSPNSVEYPEAVAVDPSGRFLYVANYYGQSVRGYAIDQNTGALTQVPGSPFPAGVRPQAITADLNGKYVYVGNCYPGQNGSISAYSIDANSGSLTSLPGSPFTVPSNPTPFVGSCPIGLAVTATTVGQVLYAADYAQNEIWEFDINAATGVPTLFPASPYSEPSGPFKMTVDPAASFLYSSLPHLGAGGVAACSIDPTTGRLTPVPGSPFSGSSTPQAAAVDQSGRFLYTADWGGAPNYVSTVSAYTIDSTTGALTPIAGSPFSTASGAIAIAIR